MSQIRKRDRSPLMGFGDRFRSRNVDGNVEILSYCSRPAATKVDQHAIVYVLLMQQTARPKAIERGRGRGAGLSGLLKPQKTSPHS